jgi:hypothetical protein
MGAKEKYTMEERIRHARVIRNSDHPEKHARQPFSHTPTHHKQINCDYEAGKIC